MDKRRQRKLRRSGTLQGAKCVHKLIKRAMCRALRDSSPINPAVEHYLTIIPPKEFDCLFKYIEEIDATNILKKCVHREARRRAEKELLTNDNDS